MRYEANADDDGVDEEVRLASAAVRREQDPVDDWSVENLGGSVATAEPASVVSPVEVGYRDESNENESPALAIDLAHRQLKRIDPATLTRHRGIVHLDLYDNLLTSLPPELGELAELASLDVSDNRLRELPVFISYLSRLESLNVSENELADLPESVFDLRNLTTFRAKSNNLQALSSRIALLARLEELDLESNELRDLPEELGRLKSLRILNLGANQLSRIPATIGMLARLETLDLVFNGLRILPDSIVNCRSLQVLDLSSNSLRELPADIGRLRKLRVLNLASNKLASLPPGIGQMSQLDELDLTGNELTTLPKELGYLPDNVLIKLDGNPLAEPLPTLVMRGTAALLSYLRSLEASTPQYEAKLLLVGEGGVGKSSLIAALRGDDFVPDRPTTHGIELNSLSVEHPQFPVRMQLNSWDFGGQEVYRISHQFFFTKRALYLLVWKPREGQEENSIESWCRRIRLRAGEDARIIIVATHCEERRPEFDYQHLAKKYPRLLVGNFAVDSETSRGLDDLRQAIAENAADLPQMGELLSDSWMAARGTITSWPTPYMSRMTFERVCAAEGLDEESTATFGALLHDLGHIIHYVDDEGLRDLVVLQPEWLTKAIGYVLEDDVTRAQGGVLNHARLREIWSQESSGVVYQSEFYPYFLRLMEKFDVSYRLPDEPASLVAQLVPYQRPSLIWQDRAVPTATRRILRVVCRTADEAPGLVAWLTVRNHRFSVGRHWRRGVLLVHHVYNSQAVLELADNGRDLFLTVIGPAPDYLFHVLKDGIEDLITRRWRGLGYQFLVPCGGIDRSGRHCKGFFSYRALQLFRERGEARIVCQACAEWSDVSVLLTGFGAVTGRLDNLLESIRRTQESTHASLKRVEVIAAETARYTRIALRILSAEVSDCPRLFTLAPEERAKVLRTISTRQYFVISLWCEEPGQEHPWPAASYRFHPTKEWVESVGPYVRFVSRILHFVVPIAGALYAATLGTEQLAQVRADIDLTKTLAEKFPQGVSDADPRPARGMSRAEGAGLRALRTLLMKLDRASLFGGLRRVSSPSGDLLWVCPNHYAHYDPGLPEM